MALGQRTRTESPALALYFGVEISGLDGLYFTGCDGIGAEYVVENHTEGGSTGVHVLPVRLKYSNVKLTRPVDKHSARLATWFAETQLLLVSGTGRSLEGTGAVAAYDSGGVLVCKWNLIGVWPVRYSGPTLRTESTGVATESLELTHSGFTVSGS